MTEPHEPLAELALALQRASASALASIQAALATETGRTLKAYADAWKEVGPQILEQIAAASQQWLEEFEQAIPANWQELTHPQMFATIELMHGTGWSLIGTPPASSIEAILGTETAADRRQALLDAAPVIVEDLTAILAALRTSDLASCAEAAEDALHAFRQGHLRASQALTTAHPDDHSAPTPPGVQPPQSPREVPCCPGRRWGPCGLLLDRRPRSRCHRARAV